MTNTVRTSCMFWTKTGPGRGEKLEVAGQAAEELLKRHDLFVLDVRTPQEFQGVHLDKAVLIPVDLLERRIDEIPEDKSTPILVYCAHGVRSVFAKSLLEKRGYTQVFNLKGGLAAFRVGSCPD